MSRFRRPLFHQIIKNIEEEERNGGNIWIAIGILEYMFDDDCGYIDQYFHTPFNERDDEQLWNELCDHLQYIEIKKFVSK